MQRITNVNRKSNRTTYRKVAKQVAQLLSVINDNCWENAVSFSNCPKVDDHVSNHECSSSSVSFNDNNSELVPCHTDLNNIHIEPTLQNQVQTMCELDNCEIENQYCEFNPSIRFDLNRNLGQWATEENISLSSLGKLLQILKSSSNENLKLLPVDPRTVLHTSNQKVDYKKLGCGIYFYFGIEKTILNLFNKFGINSSNVSLIEIAVNIDGLPLHKSTGNSFWPILCLIKSISELRKEVFTVARFQGSQKPPANDLLFDFVMESINLINNGI